MSTYVIVHVTRNLPPDDPRRPRQTMVSAAELPDPKAPAGTTVSYLTPRRIELSGFSGGYVWGSLDMAQRFPTDAAARKKARLVRNAGLLVIDSSTATEFERRRHYYRALAKARKV